MRVKNKALYAVAVLLVIGGAIWAFAIWGLHTASAVTLFDVILSFAMLSAGLVIATFTDGLEE